MNFYYLDYISNYSIFLSLLLIFGLFQIGFLLDKFFYLKKIIASKNYFIYFPFFGFIFLSGLITPVVYLNLLSPFLIKIISIILIFLGVIYMITNWKVFYLFFRNSKINKKNIFLLILFLFYLIISFLPITHPDTLDYHISGGINLLKTGSLYSDVVFHHLKLASIGEVFFAIGLAIGSEQFVSLINFVGYLILADLIFSNIKKIDIKEFILLIFLSSPIYIFFLSSSKPLLFASCFSLFVLNFAFNHIGNCKEEDIKKMIILSCIASSIFFLVKASYSISIIMSVSFLFYKIYKNKFLKFIFLSAIFSIVVILLPKVYFFYNFYSQSLINSIIYNVPISLDGYEYFFSDISNIHDGGYNIFKWLIFPKNLGAISTCIGLSAFIFFFVDYQKNNNTTLLILILITLLILFFVAPHQSRFFFEPFLWLGLLNFSNKVDYKNYFIKFTSILQSSVVIIFLIFGCYIMVPSLFSLKSKHEILKKVSNGYEISKIINEVSLKSGFDNFIINHRSQSYFNIDGIPAHFLRYIKKKNIIEDKLIEFNIKYIFFYENYLNDNYYNRIKRCLIAKPLIYKNSHKKNVTRNPFNQNTTLSSIYIFKFKKNFKNCVD